MTNEAKIIMVFTDGLPRSIKQCEKMEEVKKDLLLLKKEQNKEKL